MTMVTINPGDGQGDDAAYINSILADPNVTHVILGAGTFELSRSIEVPSGKTLTGQGRDATVLQAQEGFFRDESEFDAVVNSAYGATGITLSGFSVDANKLRPDDARLLGVFMRQADGFTISDVEVVNSTGYAFHAFGASNGTYTDCNTENSNVHFEAMNSHNISYTDCHARDGDGDIQAESHFHPLVGSTNISYIDCTAISAASGGFGLVAIANPLENISIINCYVEVVTSPAIAGFASLPIIGLTILDSTFISHGNIGVRLGGASGTMENSYVQGEVLALNFLSSASGVQSDFTVIDTTIVGLREPGSGGAAYGVASAGGTVVIDGGLIAAAGALGFAFGSSNITTTGDIKYAINFKAVLPFVENGAAASIAPNLTLPDELSSDFVGGSLTVRTLSRVGADDGVTIAPAGSGPSAVTVVGNTIFYGGNAVGTIAEDGRALTISFGAGATEAAVQAVARAITFANTSENPESHVRYLQYVFTDAGGGIAVINAAIPVQAVVDVPELDLNGPAEGSLLVAYVEQAAAVVVAPEGLVDDVDSPDFAGGSLRVAVTQNGQAADQLSVAHPGVGPGAIGVAGSQILYGGVVIGTLSGGSNGQPLVIALNAAATPDAVQALVRAITFASSSDAPATSKTLTFTVDDGDGGVASGTATVQITPVDDATVATDDVVAVNDDAPVTIDVLSNDDPDSPLQIAAIDGVAVTIGQPVAIASGALVTLNADGTLTYDDNGTVNALPLGASAPDQFTYTLVGGGTATVSLTVTNVNDAPVIDLNGANAGTGTALNYIENMGPSGMAPSTLVTDIDSPILDGGTVTVAITSGADAADRLGVLNQGIGPFQVGISDGIVTWAGTIVGTVTGGENGEPLVITFNDQGTGYVVGMVTRAIVFENTSDNPSATPRTVTFTVTDGAGGTSEPVTTTIHVRPIDDVAQVIGDAATTGEAEAVTIAVLANDVDPDSPLTIARIEGADVVAGQIITLASGAIVTVNADGTLRYDPSGKFNMLVDGETALDSFTYGLAGGGTATVTVTVTGSSVNSAPDVDLDGTAPGTGATAAFVENDTPMVIAPDAVVGDTDSPDFAGGSLRVAFTANGKSEDRLAIRDQGDAPGQIGVSGADIYYGGTLIGTTSGGGNGGPLVITLNGDATPAAVQALTRAVTYRNLSETPSAETRTLSFTVQDGDGGTRTAAATVTVTPVNDAPMLDLNGGNAGTGTILDYYEGYGERGMAPFATVVDGDTPVLNGATLTVAITSGAGEGDRLAIFNQGDGPFQVGVSNGNVTWAGTVIGTVTGGTGGAPLVVTFNGQATTYHVSMVVTRLNFANVSDDPSTAPRTVTYTLTDGAGATSAPVTTIVYVAAVDDPTIPADDQATTTESAPVTIDVLTNDDPDSALTIATIAGIAATVGQTVTLPSGATVTLNADGTVRYDPNGSFAQLGIGQSAQDSFAYGLAGGGGATVTVTVNGGGEAPIVDLNGVEAGTNAAIAFTEGDDPVALAPDAIVSDADSPDFAGGSVTIAFTANGAAEDQLALIDQGNGAGQIGLSGATVLYGGIAIGTIGGGANGAALVIDLSANATPAAVQALVRVVTYDNGSSSPSEAARALRVTVRDGDGGETSAQVTIDVSGDSAPPVIDLNGATAGTGTTLKYIDGQSVAVLAPGALVSDPDTPVLDGGVLTVSFTDGGAASDRLTILNQGTGAFQVGVIGGVVTWAGLAVGTVSGGDNGDPLVITFNDKASAYIASMVARRVQFEDLDPGSGEAQRVIGFSLTDGQGGTSDTVFSTVNISPASQAAATSFAATISGAGLDLEEGGFDFGLLVARPPIAIEGGEPGLAWSAPLPGGGELWGGDPLIVDTAGLFADVIDPGSFDLPRDWLDEPTWLASNDFLA